MARSPERGNDGQPRRDRHDRREVARIVAALVALALLIAFVVDNSQTVRVGFVFTSADVSLIWVLLIAAFLGAGVDRLVVLLGQRRRKRSEHI